MKQFIPYILAVTVLAQPVFAESDKQHRHGKKGQYMQRMVEELQLSDDQKESFKQIMKEQREKRHAVFKDMHEQIKPKMEAIHDETKQRLSSVLNPEQLQRYEEMTNKMHEKMEKRMQEKHQQPEQGKDDS